MRKAPEFINVLPTVENVDWYRVYVFTDPSIVKKFKECSRPTDTKAMKAHQNNIAKQILEGDKKGEFIAPIRVDINTLEIIDGQNRVKAFLKAWEKGSTEPIKVIFTDGGQSEIARINTGQKNWSISDFEYDLKRVGDASILKLEEFGLTHALTQKISKKDGKVYSYYPRYVYAVVAGRNLSSDVKRKALNLTDADFTFGEKIYNEVEMMYKVMHSAMGFELNNWFESFCHAWYALRKYDAIYSRVVDTLGMETICAGIPLFFNGFTTVSRVSDWSDRFRHLISRISEKAA